jgi:hypothetical protein
MRDVGDGSARRSPEHRAQPLIDPARATELVAPARPSGAAHTLTGCRKDRRDGKYGVREGS